MSPDDISTSDDLRTQARQRRADRAAMHGGFIGRLGRTERLVEARIKTLIRRYSVLREMEILQQQQKAAVDRQVGFNFDEDQSGTIPHAPPTSLLKRLTRAVTTFVDKILSQVFRWGRDPGS